MSKVFVHAYLTWFRRTLSMRRLVIVLTVVSVLALGVLPAAAASYAQNDAALAWMRQVQEPDGGFSSGYAEGSDFGTTAEVILAGVAAGEDVSTWTAAGGAGASPLDYVASQVAAGAVTDVGNLSKAIFVAVATGQNPRNFGGRDLVALVMSLQDAESGWFGDTLFKHAYAVLALHNAGAPLPAGAVTAMTSQFTEDGAWALFGGTTPGTADTNTTALVMQALVAAGEPGAAAGALPYLRRMQNEDGGFPYQKPSAWGTETDANSTAVVIQALDALGEPLGNWLVNGTDPLGALLALWDEASGAYVWQASTPFSNMLATAQAVQASEGMNLVTLPQVSASNPPVATTAAPAAAPLLPASGHAALSQGLMIGVLVLVGLSALLRRK
jgi:hypothetical protein